MDIGAVLKAPFEDQDWLKKCLLMGVVNVLICITVIGIFVGLPNLIGWGVTYGRTRIKGGTTLPDFGFGYIGLGYRFIVSMLIYGIIAIVVTLVVGAIGMLLGKIASVLALVWLPVQLIVALAIALIGLPMSYRFVVHDDMMAGTKIGWAISFIMANLGTVLMFFVTVLICGLITGAMGIIPIVGGMFGAAIGQAWNMAAIAQLAKATNNA
ncbi:MAG: DUF4013 domain-containing protein [Deltaproteobacteria bacterium]|nr:DUF4013 domain-containing protein [Deltaproteobacteria bacterium]